MRFSLVVDWRSRTYRICGSVADEKGGGFEENAFGYWDQIWPLGRFREVEVARGKSGKGSSAL